MSDRFKWLEFGDNDANARETPSRPGREPDTGKDEHWHLAAANRAFDDGDYDSALRNYSAAIGYRADMEEAWAGQTRAMVLFGQVHQSLTWGKKAVEKLPTSRLVASAMAYAMAHAGGAAEALKLSDQVMQSGPEAVEGDPWFWYDRGVCLLESAQVESAHNCFEKVARLTASAPQWLQRIGLEYLLSNDPSRALVVFNKALETRSDHVYLWLLTARAASRLHLESRAREALDQALKLDPSNREAARERGKMTSSATAQGRPCWIATLVFDDAHHPVVCALREWRDAVWMRNRVGQRAAEVYHGTAPWLCIVLARCRWMHGPLRRALTVVANKYYYRAKRRCR